MFQSVIKRLKTNGKRIEAPCSGSVHPLEESKDPVFAEGLMGPGCFIIPENNHIYSPVDGTVELVFPTKHAIGLKSKTGVEVMLHIGIDTVQLDGRFFDVAVSPGDRIRKGDLLANVSFGEVSAAGYATDVFVILTNMQMNDVFVHTGSCRAGDLLMEVMAEK